MPTRYDEWRKRMGLPEPEPLSPPDRNEDAVEHLRATLTDAMATKSFQMRHRRDPSPVELEAYKQKLVEDHHDEGFDQWVDSYLYYDPGT